MAPRSRSSSAPTHGAANRTTDGTTRGKRYRGQQQERVRRAGHSRSEGTNITSQPNMRVTLNQHCRRDELDIAGTSRSSSSHPPKCKSVQLMPPKCCQIQHAVLRTHPHMRTERRPERRPGSHALGGRRRDAHDGAMPTTARCPMPLGTHSKGGNRWFDVVGDP
jgi:hypothetical protein